MPTARIVTRNRESALPLAQKLQTCGYSTLIVSPEDTRDFEPDLEIDLDQYAEGAEGALLTDQELVRFAEQHSAPELGRLLAQGSWPEDEYQDYVVEREFVLAPMWRAFRSRVVGLWQKFRPEPKPVNDMLAVAEMQTNAVPSEQPCVEPVPQSQLETIEVAAPQLEAAATASLQEAEITGPAIFGATAHQQESSSAPEAYEAIAMSTEPEQPAAADPVPLSQAIVATFAEPERPISEPAEHITFQPPTQPPQEPIVVSAALRLEALIEACHDKAAEFGIWVKDMDWTWVSRMRDEMMATAQKGATEAKEALEATRKSFAGTAKRHAGKIAMPAMPSIPNLPEVRNRLRLDRSRDRTLAFSFVLGATLAGFFLLGWAAAFHLNPHSTQSAMPAAEAQTSQPTQPTTPVVPAAAVVVPAASPETDEEPVALTESEEAAVPAVKTHVSRHSSRAMEDDSAEDVVVRHFDPKPKPASDGNTASVKHYSDLDDK